MPKALLPNLRVSINPDLLLPPLSKLFGGP